MKITKNDLILKIDATGIAAIKAMPNGMNEIRFIDLDHNDWKKIGKWYKKNKDKLTKKPKKSKLLKSAEKMQKEVDAVKTPVQ